MKATFHVVFDAELYHGYDPKLGSSRDQVRKVRAKRMTQSKPDLKGGEIVVAFSVDVPETAFLRLMPDVEVSLGAGHWSSEPVQVVVEPPTEEA